MEGETNNQETVRLERRKGITINLEIQKKPHGYPVYNTRLILIPGVDEYKAVGGTLYEKKRPSY